MPDIEVKSEDSIRLRRYRQAALLLMKWSREDPAYDERVDSALEHDLADERMRCEERDEDPA